MRYFCPNCWHDFSDGDLRVCPKCGFDLRGYSDQDYVTKLINALDHPVDEIRYWAIMILAMRKELRAVPYLEKIQKKSKDPALVRAVKETIEKITSH